MPAPPARALRRSQQTGSVSRAAEQVGITKPAMSHALSRLREQVGDPVLVRAGQKWHLSERALAMRDHVREVAEKAKSSTARRAASARRTR